MALRTRSLRGIATNYFVASRPRDIHYADHAKLVLAYFMESDLRTADPFAMPTHIAKRANTITIIVIAIIGFMKIVITIATNLVLPALTSTEGRA